MEIANKESKKNNTGEVKIKKHVEYIFEKYIRKNRMPSIEK